MILGWDVLAFVSYYFEEGSVWAIALRWNFCRNVFISRRLLGIQKDGIMKIMDESRKTWLVYCSSQRIGNCQNLVVSGIMF